MSGSPRWSPRGDIVGTQVTGRQCAWPAEHFYGLEVLTPDSLENASLLHLELMETKSRLQILQEDAGLDHVQIDDFTMDIRADEEDPSFFLYDISLWDLVSGKPDFAAIRSLTDVDVIDLYSLQTAIEELFTRYGGEAVACKTQQRLHANAGLAQARAGGRHPCVGAVPQGP